MRVCVHVMDGCWNVFGVDLMRIVVDKSVCVVCCIMVIAFFFLYADDAMRLFVGKSL